MKLMASMVEAQNGIGPNGKHYYIMWQTMFEVDTKYLPIKPIGKGAYGVVCSSMDMETQEKVAIKKINNVFGTRIDALRTLRELMLLRHIKHQNVIALKDVMMPIQINCFKDLYLVYDLMDTDLHQIIKSPQPLSNDHCKYFIFQVLGFFFKSSVNFYFCFCYCSGIIILLDMLEEGGFLCGLLVFKQRICFIVKK